MLLAGVAPAQAPPTFPPEVTGQRTVTWDYTGLRPIPGVPAVGAHPRIFVGPDQRAEFCNRLTNTVAGRELFTNIIQRYTTLLRNPRSSYDALPSSLKLMPDGSARIGNVGFANEPFIRYTNMVAGQTANLDQMIGDKVAGLGAGDVYARTMAGEMALEALECWVLQGQAGVGQRATNLAVAMDTWSTYLLNRGDFTNSSKSWMLGGGAAFAEAYDFNHGAMTPAQRANVRKALVRCLRTTPYYGVGVAPEAATSNWASLDTFLLIVVMAIEGETSVAVEGYDPPYFENYFTNAMGSTYKFLTYGWHPSGEPYEGMGKGWFGGARLVAFAKRGYNFFGHPHLRKFVTEAWPACLQPFGYSWRHYDLIGGEGTDDDRGLRYYTASDQIAMQWVYTNAPAAAFLWRNFATTAWRTNASSGYRTFLDFRESKFVLSSVYGQDMVEAACFVQEVSTNNWNTENAAARPALDWIDTHGSTIVARSGADSNAVALQFHTRQDLGGHTFADRGAFALSGLGRIWVKLPYALNYGQDSDFSSVVMVDHQAMSVTPQDGSKMRIPAKLAGWANSTNALFATCDATYAYTWKWKWNHYLSNSAVTISAGYQAETNCLNTFRRSNRRIAESYGYTPFVNFPDWNVAGYLEGLQRSTNNPMQQVLRTAGLVRGVRPYALVFDDIRKDNTNRLYEWLAQLPWDLTLKAGSAVPAGFDPATDCVLAEAATNGTRSLLVRVLSPTNWTAITEVVSNAAMNSERFYRLTIACSNVAPAFKIMLYPFAAGDPIPTNTWTASSNLTVTLGEQTDTFAFAPRTMATSDGRSVTMSEFTLARGGTTLLDYRYQIEPFATVLRPTVSINPAATNVVAGASLILTSAATGTPPLAYQWYDSTGAALGGETNAALAVLNLQLSQGGSYRVVVTNASGSATNTALVTVLPPPEPPRFTSVSVTGDRILITGTNGTAGATYLVLSSTNAALPLTAWWPILTNQFGPGGGFAFTNPVSEGTSQGFFLLRLPWDPSAVAPPALRAGNNHEY